MIYFEYNYCILILTCKLINNRIHLVLFMHALCILQFEVSVKSVNKMLTNLFPGETYEVCLQSSNAFGSSSFATLMFTLPVTGEFKPDICQVLLYYCA